MNDNFVWHYCSTASFLSIAKSETFRLGNIFFMNDSAEFTWAKKLALQVIGERTPKEDQEAHFYKHLERLLRGDRYEHVYCGCFSKHEDDLSQWRGYADNARGIAMQVDLRRIKEANRLGDMSEFQVLYPELHQRRWIEGLIDSHLCKIDNENPAVAKAHQAHFLCGTDRPCPQARVIRIRR